MVNLYVDVVKDYIAMVNLYIDVVNPSIAMVNFVIREGGFVIENRCIMIRNRENVNQNIGIERNRSGIMI